VLLKKRIYLCSGPAICATHLPKSIAQMATQIAK
jgi:hypothetical protein